MTAETLQYRDQLSREQAFDVQNILCPRGGQNNGGNVMKSL